jgi:uncharacterized pyridoxal phosphate-containing UPF0001 family protein
MRDRYPWQPRPDPAQLPEDIKWHFIGHLQSNKAKQLAGVWMLIRGALEQLYLGASL